MRHGQDRRDRATAVGNVEIGAFGRQLDIVKPALRQGKAAQRYGRVEMCGLRSTLEGKIEAVDESLNLAILQRPAKIHGAGGADEIGGKIIFTVRIDGA
ncbi:hypothetical protein D3C86_927410 [compost metagenome]